MQSANVKNSNIVKINNYVYTYTIYIYNHTYNLINSGGNFGNMHLLPPLRLIYIQFIKLYTIIYKFTLIQYTQIYIYIYI